MKDNTFTGCTVSGSNFFRANLTNTNFDGATLNGFFYFVIIIFFKNFLKTI